MPFFSHSDIYLLLPLKKKPDKTLSKSHFITIDEVYCDSWPHGSISSPIGGRAYEEITHITQKLY